MTSRLPQRIRDFFNAVSPQKTGSPLEELQGRYHDKVNALRTGAPMPSTGSTDYIVEFRIREWMMRMQREAEEEKRLKTLHDHLNRPHDKEPPRGPGNTIAPS